MPERERSLNLTAIGVYLASWTARRRGREAARRRLAFTGYALAGTAGYLGGTLVYGLRIGSDHGGTPDGPLAYTPVLPAAELREGEMRGVEVDGVPILVSRIGGQVHAIGGVCSHLGGPLAEGRSEEGTVVCPWHGSVTGAVLESPATSDVPCVGARERDGKIEVRASRRVLPAA